MIQPSWRRGLCAAACALLLVSAARGAQLDDVKAATDRWQVAQAESQQRIDTLADQRQDLGDQFRATLRDSEALKLYVQQLDLQIGSQREEIEAIKAETRELERTSIEILPLMYKMLESLEEFVVLDLPFLMDDRRGRVARVRELMPRADVTVSEKFRKILEAYQLEVEYGRTIEAYRGELEGKAVDLLRVGRVALLYQTPDGAETGYWDAAQKNWVKDDSYGDSVAQGLKVARKQTTPDLLIAPIPAPKKGA